MTVHFGDKTSVFLPSPHQELLLKACLFEGEEVVPLWQAWRADNNPDAVDIGSLRLLPLLAHKLPRLGVTDSAFKKYRGMERRTWVHNHLLFRAAGQAVRQLETSGIATMALKGVVLALTYYETMSLRPMDDFDLLVRPKDGLKTFELLEGLGWRAVSGQLRPRAPIDFAIRAASALEDPANREVQVDLHWRLFWARYSDEAETALWDRAVHFEIGGEQCLAPCAADMLVHVCAHGAMWNDIPPVRWVIDAAFVVRSGAVDWIYFCDQTERLGLTLPLVETLNYLRSVMRVAIPDMVMQRLTRDHVKSIDRLIYQARLQPPAQWNLLTALRLHHHIAWHEVARDQGPIGYWRYFVALLRGRRVLELVSWARRRLVRSTS